MGTTKAEHLPETPMHQLTQTHVHKNVEAFGALLDRNVESVDYIVEGMGGMGNQTRWLREKYKCRKHIAYEIDEICVNELKTIKGLKVKHASFFDSFDDFGKDLAASSESLLIFDYNSLTQAPHNWKVIKPVLELGFKWVVGPDLSRGKLHLNYKSYGFDSPPTFEQYVKSFNKLSSTAKMKIVDHSKAPRAITYLLWKRS